MKQTIRPLHFLNPLFIYTTIALAGIHSTAANSCDSHQAQTSYYGTLDPFASEAIYFLLLDRFVDGDPANNHEDQGGDFPTWDQKLIGPNGEEANVGYLGGDFQGVINNLDYIKAMGFTAIWTTPFTDNPDENFSGGEPITYGGMFKDGGKTGYHGYWTNNFFVEDEHYVSPQKQLDFEAYANALHEKELKVILDIVVNHTAPSFTMPAQQPKFGQLFDQEWNLVADHQNLLPTELDPENSLHDFFYKVEDFMQLSNIDDSNPEVLDYFTKAYLSWIEKGADAIRIDTIRHVSHSFWKSFSDNVRSIYPGFFMFGESFVYDANFIAQHTLPKNGNVSVLDFPGQEAIEEVFSVHETPEADARKEEEEAPDTSYSRMAEYLHLTHGPYHNPYDLVTFYDNHDMPRINATDEGFIDANNWLFTSRGIPCIYYGAEMGFMKGKAEHEGNRNYYGQDNVEKAKTHPIYKQLARIAKIRQQLVSLQRGLQLNIDLSEDQAVFLRVFQHNGTSETALVALNKSGAPVEIPVSDYLQAGKWTNVETGETQSTTTSGTLTVSVAPHSFSIWTNDDPIRKVDLIKKLDYAMEHK